MTAPEFGGFDSDPEWQSAYLLIRSFVDDLSPVSANEREPGIPVAGMLGDEGAVVTAYIGLVATETLSPSLVGKEGCAGPLEVVVYKIVEPYQEDPELLDPACIKLLFGGGRRECVMLAGAEKFIEEEGDPEPEPDLDQGPEPSGYTTEDLNDIYRLLLAANFRQERLSEKLQQRMGSWPLAWELGDDSRLSDSYYLS